MSRVAARSVFVILFIINCILWSRSKYGHHTDHLAPLGLVKRSSTEPSWEYATSREEVWSLSFCPFHLCNILSVLVSSAVCNHRSSMQACRLELSSTGHPIQHGLPSTIFLYGSTDSAHSLCPSRAVARIPLFNSWYQRFRLFRPQFGKPRSSSRTR